MPTLQETFSQAIRLHKAGNLPAAEALYRQVIDAEPNHVLALSNLGALTYQADRPEETVKLMRRVLAIQPDVGEFHLNLAAALQATDDVHGALAEYREAVRLQPSAPQFHIALGETLLHMGDTEGALACGKAALEVDPLHAPAFGILGELVAKGQHALSDEDLEKIQSLLRGGQVPPRHASVLYFALGTWWEKQGKYDDAFRAFHYGNELKRQLQREAGQAFDRPRYLALVDYLIRTFTSELFERARPFGSASERPIFVVGMPRSGTTLTEQILASHPQVFGCGELRDMERMAAAFYPTFANGVDQEAILRYADHYLQVQDRVGGAGAVRTIDKMPQNFHHLGMIAILFPHARIVHCRRDPMDVCISTYVQNFQRVPYATSLEDLGLYYRQYERLMDHWRCVLPLPMYEVVYEDLVADQERVTRELIAFCGVPWDDRCLAFHKTSRPVRTPSRLRVRQPIYKHAVARWKRFAAHLQPLRDALAGKQ